MTIHNRIKYICLLLLGLLASCVEPYSPEILEAPNRFLVVNGFINTNGTTQIQLLRTQNLNEVSQPIPEANAVVVIEEQQGQRYPLLEQTVKGTYASRDNLKLNTLKKYRLYIKLAKGQEYASDYVEAKQTPPVNSVIFRADGNNLRVYVNSSDPANNSRYYRWEYEETWEFTSSYYTNLKVVKDSVEYITPTDEPIFRCWQTGKSSNIALGNTVRLSQDVISEFPLLAVPSNSPKLSQKYSVLVKQYALTKEAYQYLEILKKNTENIGTLFDPLPSQLTGNIHSLNNPEEPVIGYVAAVSVQEKRVFIDRTQLPEEWRLYYPTCPQIDTVLIPGVTKYIQNTGKINLPVYEMFSEGMGPPRVVGYIFANKDCVDCRVKGTNLKPGFWE